MSSRKCVFVKGVLDEMGLTVDTITLYMDSKSTICLAQNPLYHKRSKLIDIKYHWTREKTMGGYPIVRLKHNGTEYMDANIFTKALEYILFIKHAAIYCGWVEGIKGR